MHLLQLWDTSPVRDVPAQVRWIGILLERVGTGNDLNADSLSMMRLCSLHIFVFPIINSM